jgi:glycosyltransferase involved in cell wall biosynthesis
LIHKGLDLLLEVFKNNPNLHLHVCGPIDNEPGFKTCFYDDLYKTENIHTYGFVGLRSDVFNNLMKTCAFVIFPSCSEGGGASVVNVMANGGLLPIVTKEASIDINDYGIEIKGYNLKDVALAVDEANRLTVDDIRNRSYSCGEYVSRHHSIDMFSKTLKDTLQKVL